MAYWLWASQKFNSHLADFRQVKNISAFSLYKTPLGETGCLWNPYFFTYWLPKYPGFWFTPLFSTQSVKPPLATYPWLCNTCVTYGMPCHAIGHQVLPTPAFNIMAHPSVSYRQVFRPILYFQPSSSQSGLRLCPNPNPCLGECRISLGVRGILSMHLCSHT